MVAVAIMAITATLIAHHLGFFDALLSILSKVLKCYKCCTFWVVLCTLLYYNSSRVLAAVVIAFAAAYLSHWIMLLFGELNMIYNRLWERQEKRRTKRRGK
jgi:hypothetical protein